METNPLPTTRRRVRLSHLTMAYALKRMLKGPFTATDLVEATGLSSPTAYEFMRSMRSQNVIQHAGHRKDLAGRMRIKTYIINLEAK